MTPIGAAMAWSTRQDDKGEWAGVRITGEDGECLWAIAMAAACSLSGQLDDARSMADLEDAARHFGVLVDIGVMGQDDITAEIIAIIQDIDAIVDDDLDEQAFEARRREELADTDDADAVLAEVDALCAEFDAAEEEERESEH